jgi:hypothetical protein
LHYLNVEMKIRHRNLNSSNVYLALEEDKIKAYVGDFAFALTVETPGTLRRIFNVGEHGFQVVQFYFIVVTL